MQRAAQQYRRHNLAANSGSQLVDRARQAVLEFPGNRLGGYQPASGRSRDGLAAA